MPNQITTGKVRLSYLNVFEPKPSTIGGDPKYSVTLLIPKTDTQTYNAVMTAMQAAIDAAMPKLWDGQRPPILNLPLHDGDGGRPSDGLPYGDECKGHWVMTASSVTQPLIIHPDMSRIIDKTEIYSGMYACVSAAFFGYATGKKGIGCGLNNIMKVADGEPLGGRTTPEQDFADVAPLYLQPQLIQSPQYPPQQPQYPQQPAQYAQQPAPPAQYAPPQPQYSQPAPYAQPQYRIDPITGAQVPA
jgi:hypothetical protein